MERTFTVRIPVTVSAPDLKLARRALERHVKDHLTLSPAKVEHELFGDLSITPNCDSATVHLQEPPRKKKPLPQGTEGGQAANPVDNSSQNRPLASGAIGGGGSEPEGEDG